jgi:hypothetical protein
MPKNLKVLSSIFVTLNNLNHQETLLIFKTG